MRKDFFKYLHKLMKKNKDIVALTGDLGYGGFDRIRDEYPARFVNTGAAETSMMNIAAGLILEGKIPVVYSITPFLLYRAFEVIRTYINHERLPVIMIGSGRDKDYAHDGFSHDATDDKTFMQHFKNIISRWPESTVQMEKELKIAIIDRTTPTYINLKR